MAPYAQAWHEAGHALMAHQLGGSIRHVTLEPEEAGAEAATAVEWSSLSRHELARCSATVALAGPVAEMHFRDEDAWEDTSLASAWRADWAEAEHHLGVLAGEAGELESVRDRILAQLRRWIGDPPVQERIARIADALDAHGTLDETLFEDALG